MGNTGRLARILSISRRYFSAGIASKIHENAERLTCRFLNIRHFENGDKSEIKPNFNTCTDTADAHYRAPFLKAKGLKNKLDASVLQHINQHLPSFKIDELITLGTHLARICSDYGTWMGTNTREFQAAISTCHLCLDNAIYQLDAKQLYAALFIQRDIKRRYNALGIDLGAIIKRLSKLAEHVPKAAGTIPLEFPDEILQAQQRQGGQFKEVYRRFIERLQRLHIQEADAAKHCAALVDLSMELFRDKRKLKQEQTEAILNAVKVMVKHESCPLEQVVKGCLTLLNFDDELLHVLRMLYNKIIKCTLDLYMPMDEHSDDPMTDFALKCTALVLDSVNKTTLVQLIYALHQHKLVDQHSAALVVPLLIDALDRNNIDIKEAYKCMKMLLNPFIGDYDEPGKNVNVGDTVQVDGGHRANSTTKTPDPWQMLYNTLKQRTQLAVTSLHYREQTLELKQIYPFTHLACTSTNTGNGCS